MHRITRRAAAALAVPALALTGLIVTSTPASAAAADPGPAAAASSWLESQLTDGLIHNDQYDSTDYGLSIDTALALDAVGGHDDTVGAISDAVFDSIDTYTTGDASGDTGSHYAGAVAKALWFSEVTGDPDADLQQQLEELVSTEAPTTGRIADVSTYGDYANVLGQAYAAQGLYAAGSSSAEAVTDFLVDQQCDEGWFRLSFSDPDAADQTCDGDATSTPDTDATAIALMAMVSQHNADLEPAIDKAETWLLSTQKPSGAWGGGKTTKAANANSTGLAGWALAELGGDDAAVARAAAWVRGHQLTNVDNKGAHCVYFADADRGAIGYDTSAVDAAGATPIDAEKQDQFRRTTAQALPVLQWAPSGEGDRNVLFARDYVKAGSTVSVGVIGATPGEALCAMHGEESVLGFASADGEAHLPVALLKKAGKSTITVANVDGRFGAAHIHALGKKKLHVSLRSKVAPGAKQVVKVSGLAPGETVSVEIKWPSTGHSASGSGTGGQANGKGKFTATVKVPHKPGTAKVKVTGAFGNRKSSKTFTVTR